MAEKWQKLGRKKERKGKKRKRKMGKLSSLLADRKGKKKSLLNQQYIEGQCYR